jgi:hypothetical protein
MEGTHQACVTEHKTEKRLEKMSSDPVREFVDKMESIIQHDKDGTLKERTLKGQIDIGEGKIINVGQITKYYFGNLVKGMVPEGAEIRKNRFGGKIAKLKEKTKFGGKFLKLTLKQWRERTKLP